MSLSPLASWRDTRRDANPTSAATSFTCLTTCTLQPPPFDWFPPRWSPQPLARHQPFPKPPFQKPVVKGQSFPLLNVLFWPGCLPDLSPLLSILGIPDETTFVALWRWQGCTAHTMAYTMARVPWIVSPKFGQLHRWDLRMRRVCGAHTC